MVVVSDTGTDGLPDLSCSSDHGVPLGEGTVPGEVAGDRAALDQPLELRGSRGAPHGDPLQRVRALRYDCDLDAIVALVDPAGPACHTGERSCFFQGETDPVAFEALAVLERTIAERAAQRPDGSYTAELLADPALIGDKVREEADEVARAAAGESDERVREEAADVLYHLAVLLASRGMGVRDAFEELNARRGGQD